MLVETESNCSLSNEKNDMDQVKVIKIKWMNQVKKTLMDQVKKRA